jgi:hypothetical protein
MIELDGMQPEEFRKWRRKVREELRHHRIKLIRHGADRYRLCRRFKKHFGQQAPIMTKPLTFAQACHAAIPYITPSNPEK